MRSVALGVILVLGACGPPVASEVNRFSSPLLPSLPASEARTERPLERAFPGPQPSSPLPPRPFAQLDQVRLDELLAALERAAVRLDAHPVVRAEYEELLASHQIEPDAEAFREYVRVRLVFEATRDGGLWGLEWAVTNRIGHSDRIWAQWQQVAISAQEKWQVTAVAECDELSALFAFLTRRLGVKHTGFLGGGPNHIVGHWTVRRPGRREVRVVVPTSQIYLTPTATLGTKEINAYSAPVVWDYWRQDVPDDLVLPAPLARYFVEQIDLVAWPQARLQAIRNQRGGS